MVQVFSNGPFTTRPEIRGVFGCATATHYLAAATAMRILEAGGNAFDAAVAAGFALQVVEPHLNGPSGEVPILFWDAREKRTRVLCGQGVAPQAATIAQFHDRGLDMVPGTGLLAACVPGAFGAWLTLLRDHGTMRLSEVLEPTIELAEAGFPIGDRLSQTMASMQDLFTNEWTSSAAVFMPNGSAPQAGSIFRNPGLAATYRRIVEESAGGTREIEIQRADRLWYQGFVAEEIDKFCRNEFLDSSGRRHSGLLTGQDLASWRPSYEEPVSRHYGGVDVFKCGGWTQGPAFLQWLGLLEGTNIAELDPLGSDFIHLLVETGKLALADRDAWLGDIDAPVEDLLSQAYIDSRRALISGTCSVDLIPGSPGGRTPYLPLNHIGRQVGTTAGVGEPTFLGAGEPTFVESFNKRNMPPHGDTCHISVVDRFGNMVSATPSGGWFQASPVIPALGFPLGTRTQMFWLADGMPASLAPGKRPRTTLTPTLVTRDGQPHLGFGTPGGDQQEQWSIAFLLRHLHHGYNLQQAIDAPAFHTNHLVASFWPRDFDPGSLVLESRFSDQVGKDLEARGHKLTWTDDWKLGRLCAVGRDRTENGFVVKAAANPRGMQDYAVGR